MNNPTSSELHPVVRAFVEREKSFVAALRDISKPREPAIEAMIALADYIKDKGEREKVWALAESAQAEPLDRHVRTLLFSIWAVAAATAGRFAEAEALFRQARSMVADDTPPVIEGSLAKDEGQLAAHISGNWGKYLAGLDHLLDLLPVGSRIYSGTFLEKAFLLARLGMASDVSAELSRLPYGDTQPFRAQRNILELINCVETVRVDDLAGRQSLNTGAHHADEVAHYLEVADLIINRWNVRRGANAPGPTLDSTALAHRVMELLFTDQPQEALMKARESVGEDLDASIKGVGISTFNMIRAELACGNSEAARRLIAMRCDRGNRHYLDNFFVARLELLSGNPESARSHFAMAVKDCKRYGAMGRLLLELRMACELNGADAFLLVDREFPIPMVEHPSASGSTPDVAEGNHGAGRIIGVSAVLAGIRDMAARFAALDVPVLVTGETGTGKELVAQTLHELGPHAGEPFLAINCGAIAESLVESELFGHKRGAFTGAEKAHRGLFEEAGNGSLLLDEIGDIPARLQVVLLRVLETGAVRPVGSSESRSINCRIIAATSRNLAHEVEQGRFRQDLYYRLKRLVIHIPPLRQRPEDILPMAVTFLREGRTDSQLPVLSAELEHALKNHAWPGNVRELRNAIERMRIMNSDKLSYGVGDLDLHEISDRVRLAERNVAPSIEELEPIAASSLQDEIQMLRLGNSPLRRLERLRDMFARHCRLTRAEVVKLLNISTTTATKDLRVLCEEGLIEKVKPSGSPRSHFFRLRQSPPGS